jgi:hypothetical protein
MDMSVGTPPPGTAEWPYPWSFWLDGTTTRGAVGNIRALSAKFTQKLSGFGTATVRMGTSQATYDTAQLLQLWRFRLWIYYRNTPVWCGCVTGIDDAGESAVDLTLTELPGYLTRRVFDTNSTYTQIEQVTIAADLAAPVADVGVALRLNAGSGFLRDRTYQYLEGESRGALLQSLSGVIGGPEFRSEYSFDPATLAPQCTLHIAYPQVGSASADLGLQVPGQAVAYGITWDSDQYRTRTFAVGDLPAGATTDQKPVKVVDNPQVGIPRLDAVDEWQGVVLLTTLQEKANSNAQIYGTPVIAIKGTVSIDFPLVSEYNVGDQVTVIVTDPLLPDGFWQTTRLTERSVSCDDGTVEWTLVTTQPPAQPRLTLTKKLAQLDRRTSGTFVNRCVVIP